MKPSQILIPIVAFLIGIGAMAAIKGGGKSTDNDAELAKLKAENEALKSRGSNAGSAAPIVANDSPASSGNTLSGLPAQATDGVKEPDPDAGPEEQIAKLFNSPEARNLMKGFAGAMKGRAGQWIGGEVDKYVEKLDLTDDQAANIKKRMTAMVDANTEKFQAQLDDDSKSMQDIMESQGDFWQQNEAEIEGMLKEELNEDQFAQFEREQLVEKTERVQRRADSELEKIDAAVELSDAQEDQVFDILVRQSPEYDAAMSIEGTETELPAAALADEVTKEDAIRSVLTPEQTETYNSNVESGAFNPRRRRGPWGR